MESTKYIPQKSKKRVFPETGSSSCMEPEVIEIPPPLGNRTPKTKSMTKLLKQKEVHIHEIIDVDMDEDCHDLMLIDMKVDSNKKGKEARAVISSGPSSAVQLDSMGHVQSSKKNFAPASNNFFDVDGIGFNYLDVYADDYVFDDEYSVLQSHFDNIDIPAGVEAPIPWLPDGIVKMNKPRASACRTTRTATRVVPSTDPAHARTSSSSASHLPKPSSFWSYAGPSVNTPQKTQVGGSSSRNNGPHFPHNSNNMQGGGTSSTFSELHTDLMYTALKGISQGPLPTWKKYPYPGDAYWDAMSTPELAHTFSNPMEDMLVDRNPGESSSVSASSRLQQLGDDDVMKNYEDFKKFDTVQDHSGHYYSTMTGVTKQPPKNWAKKIQEEWRILEKDLPDISPPKKSSVKNAGGLNDTIFVRVYESRMDLLRAVIIGAEGTPYHDGLFFFDVCFPSSYPNVPPQVHYHSGGLRINPNLYEEGKVCLSLLNTWAGGHKERWIPGVSTMLQVLVSIQGLILNAKPYFNEPGFANSSGTIHGDNSSTRYNENTLILSLKTMVYSMRKPPKHFEELVIGHFRTHARDILMACKAYVEGAQVGCLVRGGVQDVDEVCKSSSQKFRNDVASYVKTLVQVFKGIGAKDTDEFLSLSQKITPLSATSHGPVRFPSTHIPAYNYPIPPFM